MTDPDAFAAEWIAAWNSHDLDRILSHYADDVVFLSPVAQARVGNGCVEGVEALRRYWSGGLAAQPDLEFTLEAVLTGARVPHHSLSQPSRPGRGRDLRVWRPREGCPRSFACYRRAA